MKMKLMLSLVLLLPVTILQCAEVNELTIRFGNKSDTIDISNSYELGERAVRSGNAFSPDSYLIYNYTPKTLKLQIKGKTIYDEKTLDPHILYAVGAIKEVKKDDMLQYTAFDVSNRSNKVEKLIPASKHNILIIEEDEELAIEPVGMELK